MMNRGTWPSYRKTNISQTLNKSIWSTIRVKKFKNCKTLSDITYFDMEINEKNSTYFSQ